MSKKIIGIFVCMLLLTTCVIPVMADTTKDALSVSSNDLAFDLTIKLLIKLIGYSSLAACIIKDNQIIWSIGYGYYDRSELKHATTDTIYNLMSISKTITGTALMQLYEQGLFELDDDVNTFLPFDLRNPNFPDDPITFRMLLSHTSSLYCPSYDYYWNNFSGDPPFNFYPEQFLKEYLLPGGEYYDPGVWSTEHRPGEYALYVNVGFEIIAYLVELISGELFLEYCDTYIFSPLDMKNTGFNLSCLDIDQVAIPYWRVMCRYYKINELRFWFERYTPPDQYWRIRWYPAGGLYSTVSDLSHFLIAHMNDGIYNGTRILQKETVELMHEIQPGNQIDYGLAWYQDTIWGINVTGHSGGNVGVNTEMCYNQTEEIGVIWFANGCPGYFQPLGEYHVFKILNYLLFTKEGTFKGKMQHNLTISSDPFFLTPFKQFLETHPKQ